MPVLRADPWTPDHGMGFEARLDETPASADPAVESEDWSSPVRPGSLPPEPVWFVDGVRRIELRLLADEEGVGRAPGLFGSAGVGAVRCDGRASFADHAIDRAVVLGGGLRSDPVVVDVGTTRLEFRPVTEAGSDPDQPLAGLQKAMQKAEAGLAANLAGRDVGIVLADGRLGFLDPTAAPIVGVVKRFVRAYLEAEHDALLARLGPGERTPLFGLIYEGQPLERYAWYTRLAPSRPEWHDHAGLVRCEVRAGIGLDEAVGLADRVSAMLPRFAGRVGDPRAPQNLAPVAALEAWLRHRLGHRGVVRRALIDWLIRRG